MQPTYLMILYAVLFVGAFFLADGIAGFSRVARGKDDDAVERRLIPATRSQSTPYALLRPTGSLAWGNRIPLLPIFSRLVQNSGTGLTVERALVIMGFLSFLTLVPLFMLLPPRLLLLAVIFAPLFGIGLVVYYLRRARKTRLRKFEEQLPEAIDLIVRSLRVGHPLSGAMAVVGRELPIPISTEFQAAYDEVTYGQDIPTAFAKMAERIPVPDLGYLSMAIQIQQESGGNLVESLSKLSQVIRDRFRMFRKVRALTAEGRFSAKFLSLFPVFLIFIIQWIKPDYYTQVMDMPIFPILVMVTIILLLINVVAMRIMTNIKV